MVLAIIFSLFHYQTLKLQTQHAQQLMAVLKNML